MGRIGWVMLMGASMLAGAACGSSNAEDDGDGDSGMGGTGGQAATTPTCAAYCAQIADNCTGDEAMYASEDICMATCAHFPVGAIEDVSGNTLGCRLYHSGAAAMDPGTHCVHAGPGGDGFCGSNCESYCTLVMTACSGQFADEQECMTTCESFPTAGPFNANIKTGNTLECRLYHVSVASVDNLHCPHVGAEPTEGTCTD